MPCQSQVLSELLKGKPGIFTRKAALLVDDGGFKKINFRLTGRILAKEKTELVGGGP